MQVFGRDVMQLLEQPYPTGTPRGLAFNRVLQVHIDELHELMETIDADMSETLGGIGWWAGHPIGDRRRILASDHLLQCVRGIERNIVDARLHQLALQHCDELERRMTLHITNAHRRQGTLQLAVATPPARNATDDLPMSIGDLHRVGFFQAIGSALDCLGAAMVGVLGIPVDLLKSDLDRVRNWFREKLRKQPPQVQPFFGGFSAALEQAIVNSGPTDWLPWSLDMRNMLVHRARRFQFSTLVPRATGLVNAIGEPQFLTEETLHLPRAPAQSDVEVMIATRFEPLLEESSATTIDGIQRSTNSLVKTVCRALVLAWRFRAASPNAIPQPLLQWRDTPRPAPAFPGYAPGTSPVRMQQLHSNPQLIRRLRVALLDDQHRGVWDRFDP